MELIENKYEMAGLMMLPPHARDVADHLLTVTPLNKLMEMREQNQPDTNLLKQFNAPAKLWLEILNAALLAKTTYFLDNPYFTEEELLFLIKTACSSINMPLEVYSIKDVLEMSAEDYPVFCDWLKELTKHLKNMHS